MTTTGEDDPTLDVPAWFCGYRWEYMPQFGDPRLADHVCGLRSGHVAPHVCRDCGATDPSER